MGGPLRVTRRVCEKIAQIVAQIAQIVAQIAQIVAQIMAQSIFCQHN
jgi:hypothetical protein